LYAPSCGIQGGTLHIKFKNVVQSIDERLRIETGREIICQRKFISAKKWRSMACWRGGVG